MSFLLSQHHTTEQVIYKEKILLRILEAWKFKRMVPAIGEQHHRETTAGVHETVAWGPNTHAVRIYSCSIFNEKALLLANVMHPCRGTTH